MRCAVLGDPIGHSLSPVIHRAAYEALGLDWEYDAVRVPAGGLAEFLDGLDASWRGLSLTMPLKREVLPLLDSQDAWVHATGACNTVVLEADGQRHGLNTDVTGALMVLGETEPLERAVVLGGGATAASMMLALTEHGTRAITLVVRDPARAEETLVAVAGQERPPTVEVRTLEEVSAASLDADIVVSTIPVPAQVPELLDAVAGIPVVFEVLYDPWPTPLAAASFAGRTLFTGLDLLVAQAVNQVVAMTGRFDAPVGAMRRAAEHELAARSGR